MDEQPTPEQGKVIASYLIRVTVREDPDDEVTNLEAQTNSEIEELFKTQLGYTYGSDNVRVSSERLDK